MEPRDASTIQTPTRHCSTCTSDVTHHQEDSIDVPSCCCVNPSCHAAWCARQSTGVIAPLLTGILLDRGGCPTASDSGGSGSTSGGELSAGLGDPCSPLPTSHQPFENPTHARRLSRERLTMFQQRAHKKGAGRLMGTALTVRHDSLQGGSSPLPAGCAAAWRAVFGICTALFVVGLIGSASFACLKNNCWRTHQANAAPLLSLPPPRISLLLLTSPLLLLTY